MKSKVRWFVSILLVILMLSLVACDDVENPSPTVDPPTITPTTLPTETPEPPEPTETPEPPEPTETPEPPEPTETPEPPISPLPTPPESPLPTPVLLPVSGENLNLVSEDQNDEDVPELRGFLAFIAGPGILAVGVFISGLLSDWDWYNQQSRRVKQILPMIISAVISISAYLLITYVPIEVFDALEPLWQIIASAIIIWLGSEGRYQLKRLREDTSLEQHDDSHHQSAPYPELLE